MKVLIAGDFCPRYRVAEKFEKDDYEPVLGEVKDIVSGADYSIVNLECPVTKGGEMPIEKCGPNLQCSEKGIEAVRWVGFNCVTLANNHFLDYGREGVKHTLDSCKKNDVDTVGGGMDLQEASEILYKEIKGEILAIVNCCEHEFSIATDDTAGSNPLNPIQQYYAIKEARLKADYVLVIVHGGHEYYQLPSPRMQETYRFFVDAGADAIINHHQHCYSGYEVYKGKPIFYGLGNFLFDGKKKIHDVWNEGYFVDLFFSKTSSPQFSLIPYSQCNDLPTIVLQIGYDKSIINRKISELNEIIVDDIRLSIEHEKFMKANGKSYISLFQPYKGRLLNSLYVRGLLPTFISKKEKNRILDYIECESHLDTLRYNIKK